MSITSENSPAAVERRGPSDELRLLHVGVLGNPACYTSLEFLFTKVFPLLDSETLSRLKFESAGKCDFDGALFKAIREMADPYPMVQFSGFVDDIRTAYQRNDLQVVASTQATGTRTRIVESWAYGMPVLSTTVGTGGVAGLEPGKNILIADDPRDFARALKELVHAPRRLDEIAAAARQSYETEYGRGAVAGALGKLLNSRFGLELNPERAMAEKNRELSAVS
jgi:glycosyltransferase involved in cell wall biosynthesis